MKIAVLTYVEQDEDNPLEADPVVVQVMDALRANGHDPKAIGAHADAARLVRAIEESGATLIFNLLETFAESPLGDVSVAGLLELTRVPFTGGGAGDLYLAQNKALTKKLLAFEHVRYPRFAVFGTDSDLEIGGKLRMPLFVKPLRMDASIGVDVRGLVHDTSALLKRVSIVQAECGDAALVEEYIDGREFYVGVLGNGEPRALPPIEMDFSGLPPGTPRVLDRRAKWDAETPEYAGTKARLAAISPELRARLSRTAVDAARAVQMRDYGRVDLRMNDAGEIYVLEVNANCYLERSGEFATSAQADGMSYPDLIEAIVNATLQRYERVRASRASRFSRTA